ncbi:RDD family protein [Microbacteriaceae bacterium VKM Ac-2854]|nr:RDD family protein [Microbacteriaceae bacterium VKM Ac-2854]
MTETSTAEWVCANCSTRMPASARFCRGCGAAAETSGAPAPAPGAAVIGVPAAIGRRVGAVLIDGSIAFVINVIAGLIIGAIATGMLASATDYSAYNGIVAFASIAPNVISIGWWLIYTGMQGGRGSFGMRMLGLRLVAYDTLEAPGFGRAAGRNIVYALCGVIIVGYFSPLFDKSGENRGWHDQASNTLMLDVRSAAPAAPRPTAFAAAPPTTSVAVLAPSEPAPEPVAPVAEVAAPFSAAPIPPAPLAPAPLAPAPAVAFVAPPAPAAPAPGSGVISAVPGVQAPAVLPLDDDVELTRMSVSPLAAPRRSAYRLQFDDGTAVLVTDSALIGRNPAPRAGEAAGELVALADDTRSISKTHARLELVGDELSVIDRHSTNGTAVIIGGVTTPVPAGGRARVPSGATLVFGDRTASVESA